MGIFRLSFATGLLLGLAACSNETTVMSTDDGEVRASADGSMVIESKDGTTTRVATAGSALDATAASAAARLPDFAPVYPGSTIVSAVEANDPSGGGGSGVVLAMESSDSLATIMEFYDERLKASGKTAEMSVTQADSALRGIGSNDESDGALINVSDGGETRTVVITVGR